MLCGFPQRPEPAFGQACSIRRIEALPAWELPLSTTQYTVRAEAYGSVVITCSASRRPNVVHVLGLDAVEQVGVVDVPASDVGEGAVAFVFELDPGRPPGLGGSVGCLRPSACSCVFSSAQITYSLGRNRRPSKRRW